LLSLRRRYALRSISLIFQVSRKVDCRFAERRKLPQNTGLYCASTLIFVLGSGEKARNAGRSRRTREKFSELQTEWRRTQSSANPSLGPKFPLPGNFTGIFALLSGPGRIYSRVNTGVNGFQVEIVTGNEQGNNRRDNRKKFSPNRLCSHIIPSTHFFVVLDAAKPSFLTKSRFRGSTGRNIPS
jgi:hypothetical protein